MTDFEETKCERPLPFLRPTPPQAETPGGGDACFTDFPSVGKRALEEFSTRYRRYYIP